jgi:ribosome-binding protein aMBF1 (putative translation factor)
MKSKNHATFASDGENGSLATSVRAKHVTVKGKRMVMLDQAEFERLLVQADEFEPSMPKANADGTYPALEALRADLALRIVRHRRKAGLTQAELAHRAGVRLSLLKRIEQGHFSASMRTIEKIDRVLCDLVEE